MVSTNPIVLVLYVTQFVFGASTIIAVFSNAVMLALVFMAFYNLFSVVVKKVKKASSRTTPLNIN